MNHQRFLASALYISEISYSLWDIWKDSSDISKRKIALKSKARAMVKYDRMLNEENR